MKKLISILLVAVMVLSLCACGHVEIGPLTFHFSDIPEEAPMGEWIVGESAAVEAPSAEMPAEEIAPMEANIYCDEFELNFLSAVVGNFAMRGVTESLTTEGFNPYLIITFTYNDLTCSRGDMYITDVIIGNCSYPLVDPIDSDHFVCNIERYFGYDYAFESAELSFYQAKAFACFHLDDMAMAMLEAGEPIILGVNGEYFECCPTIYHAEMIDEILIGEEALGNPYDIAHAGATFLWALDFSHYLTEQIRASVEEHGDTGYIEDDRAPGYLANLFFSGMSISPAVTPNFNGEFHTDFGPMPFYIDMAFEVYPDIVDLALEYADICTRISDIIWSDGNYDEVMSLIDNANELYTVMCDILMAAYEVELRG